MIDPHPAPLTRRQEEALEAILRYYTFLRSPVPVSYVAAQLGVSHVRARVYLATLSRKGWLQTQSSPATPRPFLVSA